MQSEIADYLRAKAQDCMMLARSCGNTSTATGLRAIAHSLITKAAECDDEQQLKDVVHLD